jgi:hypothetical protein
VVCATYSPQRQPIAVEVDKIEEVVRRPQRQVVYLRSLWEKGKSDRTALWTEQQKLRDAFATLKSQTKETAQRRKELILLVNKER